jgi:hypothetical protein
MLLKIFMSHSHDDRAIADALASLIKDLFEEMVTVSYSTDQNAGGGISPGAQWLPWILERITEADTTLVLLTPNSLKRAWVLWESGAAAGVALAAGKKDSVVPITFGMKDGDIPSPLASAQAIRGDSEGDNGIIRLIQRLNGAVVHPLPAKALKAAVRDSLPPFLETVTTALQGASPVQSVLASIPHLFSASALAGLWATAYTFSSGGAVRHHADISQLTAESERRVRATNHAPLTENHRRAFFNEIEAEVANRHLIGHWRNLSDTRYFGAIHLAVLPGECMMRGFYTTFANDVVTKVGDWIWVKLENMPEIDLKATTLRSPGSVYEVLTTHPESDGAIALEAILEKR